MPTTIFQLEADAELWQQVTGLAAKHQVSVNRFIVDAVRASLEREKEQAWREGFEAMGQDAETNHVEYLIPAAREVLFDDEHPTW